MRRARHLLTRPSVWTVGITYGALAALTFGGVGRMAIGAILFTFVEYAVHRWVFHGAKRYAPHLYDAIHGAHHRLPDDTGRRLVPLSHSLPVALAMWCAFPHGVFSGACVGYLAYEAAHGVAHVRGWLPGPLRGLRRHHARHHHVDEDAHFGVTSGVWDRVLGTGRPPA